MATQVIGGGHAVWKEPRLVSTASTMMAMGRSTATTQTAGWLMLYASLTGGVSAMILRIILVTISRSVFALVLFRGPISVDESQFTACWPIFESRFTIGFRGQEISGILLAPFLYLFLRKLKGTRIPARVIRCQIVSG